MIRCTVLLLLFASCASSAGPHERGQRITHSQQRTLASTVELAVAPETEQLAIPAGDKPPHIVLVMADDQGWGDAGYNGHPFVKTPTMDAMAEAGFVFDRFYAAAPVCSPTRASVLTGRHPIRCKVPNHGRYMRPHEDTIAEALKRVGYVTGIFGKYHLGSGQPDSPANPGAAGFDEWVIGLNFFDNDPFLSRNGVVEHRKGKGSVLLVDDAIAFLEKHAKSDWPIFAVVWFPSPHDPFKEVPDGQGGAKLYGKQKMAPYYREITLLDQQLGRLRNKLRELEIAEDTMLWYCSDNGGLNRETSGGRARKGSVYEGGLRVPGLLEWPARKLEGRTKVPVNSCDIYPTLLAITGAKRPDDRPLDGIDITPLLEGKMKRRDKPMGFWHRFQGGQATWSDRLLEGIMKKQQAGEQPPFNAHRLAKDVMDFPQLDRDKSNGHAAWTDWPYKLHRIKGSKFELYNLERDPQEQSNLIDEAAQQRRAEAMKASLAAWMRSVVDSVNGKDYPKDR